MQNARARSLADEEDPVPAPRRLHVVEQDRVEQDRVEQDHSYEYVPTYADNGRRTVKITGRPGPARRRPSPTAARIETRPDRIVLWAVLLGLFLVFMAVATANAAVS